MKIGKNARIRIFLKTKKTYYKHSGLENFFSNQIILAY